MKYPTKLKEYRYYGRIIQDMINFAIKCKDKYKKKELVYIIANIMKKNYLKWNKNTVDDNVIVKDLRKISNNKLTININLNPLISIDNFYFKKRYKNNYYFNKKKKF